MHARYVYAEAIHGHPERDAAAVLGRLGGVASRISCGSNYMLYVTVLACAMTCMHMFLVSLLVFVTFNIMFCDRELHIQKTVYTYDYT